MASVLPPNFPIPPESGQNKAPLPELPSSLDQSIADLANLLRKNNLSEASQINKAIFLKYHFDLMVGIVKTGPYLKDIERIRKSSPEDLIRHRAQEALGIIAREDPDFYESISPNRAAPSASKPETAHPPQAFRDEDPLATALPQTLSTSKTYTKAAKPALITKGMFFLIRGLKWLGVAIDKALHLFPYPPRNLGEKLRSFEAPFIANERMQALFGAEIAQNTEWLDQTAQDLGDRLKQAHTSQEKKRISRELDFNLLRKWRQNSEWVGSTLLSINDQLRSSPSPLSNALLRKQKTLVKLCAKLSQLPEPKNLEAIGIRRELRHVRSLMIKVHTLLTSFEPALQALELKRLITSIDAPFTLPANTLQSQQNEINESLLPYQQKAAALKAKITSSSKPSKFLALFRGINNLYLQKLKTNGAWAIQAIDETLQRCKDKAINDPKVLQDLTTTKNFLEQALKPQSLQATKEIGSQIHDLETAQKKASDLVRLTTITYLY